jgi:hypothetical protein
LRRKCDQWETYFRHDQFSLALRKRPCFPSGREAGAACAA